MPDVPVIHPNAVYDDGQLRICLDLPGATLARERRAGRLRFARKGNRIFYLGRWVLDWLGSEAAVAPKAVAHVG